MKLETILQLLYSNNMTEVITRATQIDNGIQFKYSVTDSVVTEVHSNDLAKMGLQWTEKTRRDNRYGYLRGVIIFIDKFDLSTPYVVQFPDGSTKKYGESQFRDNQPTSVEPIPGQEPAVLTVEDF